MTNIGSIFRITRKELQFCQPFSKFLKPLLLIASPLSGSFLMISNCFSRMTGRFCACTQKDIPKSNSKKRNFSFICFFSVESANIIKPLIFLVQKSCIFKIKSYLCNAFNKKHFWKEVLERWQSGRLRRSWKPLYREVPGVRIPVSPQ